MKLLAISFFSIYFIFSFSKRKDSNYFDVRPKYFDVGIKILVVLVRILFIRTFDKFFIT